MEDAGAARGQGHGLGSLRPRPVRPTATPISSMNVTWESDVVNVVETSVEGMSDTSTTPQASASVRSENGNASDRLSRKAIQAPRLHIHSTATSPTRPSLNHRSRKPLWMKLFTHVALKIAS